MKNLLLWCLFTFLGLFIPSQEVGAQESRVYGYVTDASDEALIGVTVRIQGTQIATITDVNGRYQLNGDFNKSSVLIFTYIGYAQKKVNYDGREKIDVKMQSSENKLGEVVVKAKSNINAIDLRAKAGIVESIDMKRLNEKPMIDMGLALQGMVPGLNVINTGDIGSKPQIRIRGNSSFRHGNTSNEPLYVLDGKIISAETFYNLNPQDIASIKVLKDAAAGALYGVKAANGVLEISSQRGYNGKMTLTYGTDMGLTMRGRRGVKLMDTDEKLELERLLQNPAAPGYRYSRDYFERYHASDPNKEQLIAEGEKRLEALRNIHTDWFKELIRNNFYQKHNISIKGGSGTTTYFLSGNYTYQGGRIEGNNKQRFSVRMGLDQQLGKIGYLMIGVSGGYAKSKSPNGSSFDPTSLVYNLNPYEQKTGELYSYPNRSYRDLTQQYQSDASDKNAGVDINVTLTPWQGFTLAYVAGLDYLQDDNHNFTPASSFTEQNTGVPDNARGIYSRMKGTTINLSSNLRATYNHVFADVHDVTLGANYDYYLYNYDAVGITGYGVGNVDAPSAINNSLHGMRQPSVRNPRDKNAQMGIGVVAGYTYNSVYDAYFTYKADASSILPADKRWNTAWAAGLGWTPTNYSWLKDNKVLSKLNIKASYGVTANLNGVTVSNTVGTFMFGEQAYEESRILSLLSLYNKDLKAEQNKSTDLGLTVELFKRIILDVNWYNRRTEQALLDVPIATSSGYSSLKRNIGILQNRGIEIGLNAKIIDAFDCRLSVGGNIAYNDNKVVSLYWTDKLYLDEQSIVPNYEVGKSYDMIYGLHSLGINPLTGYPVFLTPEGVEKQGTEPLTKNDFIALGHQTPPYSGSFYASFSYKQFDVDVSFYYVFGGKQRFSYQYVRNSDNAIYNAVSGQTQKMWFKRGDEYKEYWTPFYTQSIAEENLALYPNTRTIGSSDYIKLSSVSLRYRVPSKWLQKTIPFIRYANLGLQGSNLFTWTRYKESDPESGTLAGTMQPIFTFNLNLTF